MDYSVTTEKILMFFFSPISLEPPKLKHDVGMDILFLVDGFTTSFTFSMQKDFVKRLARSFGVSAAGSRAAGLSYGVTPIPFHSFSDFSTLKKFENAVDKAQMVTGDVRIDRALSYAENMFSFARSSVPRILILLTASKQSPSGQSLDLAIQPIRNLGVLTYVISIGDRRDSEKLGHIVVNRNDLIRVTSSVLLNSQVVLLKKKLVKGMSW